MTTTETAKDKWNMSQFLNGIGGYVVRTMYNVVDKFVADKFWKM
jgi:hypothetical protein